MVWMIQNLVKIRIGINNWIRLKNVSLCGTILKSNFVWQGGKK